MSGNVGECSGNAGECWGMLGNAGNAGNAGGPKGLGNLAQALAWGCMFYEAAGLKDRLKLQP